ncbi:MAG: XrtA system polysaccharide deacetylase [Candidatus Eisenbacteria bacterium]
MQYGSAMKSMEHPSDVDAGRAPAAGRRASHARDASRVPHVLSVDVEEYFQSETFARAVPRDAWDGIPSRVEPAVDLLLERFADARVHATFFVLGWIAERHPGMVSRIAAEGHEIASHGWSHAPILRLTPGEFEDEVVRSKRLLESISGDPVLGYRAPTFSVTRTTLWALPILARVGYGYDSSVFPVHHDRYGIPDAPLDAHRREGGIWELPLSVITLGSYRLPFAGGGYLRMYPYALTRLGLRELSRAGRPGVVYVHPWEFDPRQPVIRGVGMVSTTRHRIGTTSNESKLVRLLNEFEFATAREVLARLGCDPATRADAGTRGVS